MPRLTQLAHARLAEVLRPGDLALDATAGNGHDTLFLARLVNPGGQVLAIDCQPAALATTRVRLEKESLTSAVQLVCGDHAQLLSLTPPAWSGRVRAAVFNLGYLPGSDKAIITRPASTRDALEACLTLLAPGALLSVLVYRGHPGGHNEETMLHEWLEANQTHWATAQWHDGDHPTPDSPRWLAAMVA